MHEASLIRDLMQKVSSLAEAENARCVSGVSVWLGALSHMSAEHFREHFFYASRGTIAEGATLEIIESADTSDPNAQDLVLKGIEVET